jgi:hypothetical protein
MAKTSENAKAIAVPKRKLMTFREFVEFRKKFGDQAVKSLLRVIT